MTITKFKNDVLTLLDEDFYRGRTKDFFSSAIRTSTQINLIIGKCPNNSSELIKAKKISKGINKAICNSIKSYYEGDFVMSYRIFDELMTYKFKALNLFIPKSVSINDSFFRIRKGVNFRNKTDLFHIPLKSRTKIKGQRFSINGVPSLYLSNSIYTTWEEFNRPNLDEISFSRFQLCRPIDLFDLSLSDLKDKFSQILSLDEAIKNVSYLLLVYLCSIKVKNQDDSFKPEYIIPQFFLRWVRSNNFDGVFYDSTKVHSDSTGKFYNLVIPVRNWNKKDNYCKDLMEMFQLTPPIKLNESIISRSISKSSTSLPIKKIYSQELKLPFDFSGSIFEKIENYLYYEPVSYLEI